MKTVEELINEARKQESKEVARLTALTQIKGAESRAAEVIADQALRGRFRYCPAIGWLEWVGTHWDDDATGSLRAGEVIRRHVDELERDYRAKAIAGEPARAALLAEVVARVPEDKRVNRNHRALKPQEPFNEHATDDERSRMVDLRIAVDQADMWHNFLQKKHIAALVAICMGMDGILTRFDEWDTNLDFFNCTNGTVDLRTKTLLEHNPDDLITKIAGGPYIEGFRLDLWDRALEAVYPDIRRWFRIRMGQSISGQSQTTT